MSTYTYANAHHTSFGSPWLPGKLKRLPWLGLGALVGAVICLGASVAVLIISDGQAISSWTIQPSVYLAITVPVVNLLLAFVLAEGVDVAFWRRATMPGSRVVDLHRVWQYGKSVKSAILAGRHTNLVAVACILVVAVQINSPLLQRASKVVEEESSSPVMLQLSSSPNIPETYYTGYQSGRGGGVSTAALYSSPFLPIVNGWLANNSYPIPTNHGCKGMCRTRMQGLGLSVSCITTTMEFDLSPQYQANGTYVVSLDPSVTGTDIFIAMVADLGTGISLTSLYKDTFNCAGSLSGQQCNLTTATVEYPVVIDGNKSTIALDSESSVWGDNVLNVTSNLMSTTVGLHPKTGLLLALVNRFNASAHMRWVGAAGYEIKTTGATAQSYAKFQTDESGMAYNASYTCALGFRNPMDDMIAGARDLFFRTGLAIAQANSSFASPQFLQSQQTYNRAVFRSNYAYTGAAVSVTLVTIIPLILMFQGYSLFGRSCSLSPIAVANAFDAPLLRDFDSNLPIDSLIERVGTRSVRYGAVRVDNQMHSGARLTAGYKEASHNFVMHEVDGHETFKLCMADEDVVSDPRPGQVFVV